MIKQKTKPSGKKVTSDFVTAVNITDREFRTHPDYAVAQLVVLHDT